jgi:CheY-like chemotaxis protein
MTALLMVLMFAGFVALDVGIRWASRRAAERRTRRAREAVLAESVHLDVAAEAKTLTRAEVPGARARILAVDDEPVVLDSLRKILVLAGYSIDTVESGPEAFHLVQRRYYDVVFTDLKMPGMDGVEVVKAVKHLRPDVDVAVITGYATVESAVQTMQHGAVDYVQKPFTAQELGEFVNRLMVKREARLAAQRLPRVRLVERGLLETVAADEFSIPGGAFVSDGHAWVRIEDSGAVRVGMDDFARRALGTVERVELPAEGAAVRRGEALFAVRRGTSTAGFLAPVSGRVAAVNSALATHPAWVTSSPYEGGWICVLEPADLAAELAGLRIGKPAVEWYQQEIERLMAAGGPAERGAPQVDWQTLESRFLAGMRVAVA